MSNKKETLYKHESECQDCGATFTSDVRWDRRQARDGNYLPSWGWNVPAYCVDCAEEYGLEIRHKIDPDEAYLPWRRYVHVHLLGKDPAPVPGPTQDEQVETLLDILERLIDPIDGGVDWVIRREEDVAPFWWARQQLDSEHYTDLKQRAREEYSVDIDELADKGKEWIDEHYGTEVIEQ